MSRNGSPELDFDDPIDENSKKIEKKTWKRPCHVHALNRGKARAAMIGFKNLRNIFVLSSSLLWLSVYSKHSSLSRYFILYSIKKFLFIRNVSSNTCIHTKLTTDLYRTKTVC